MSMPDLRGMGKLNLMMIGKTYLMEMRKPSQFSSLGAIVDGYNGHCTMLTSNEMSQ